LLRVRGDKVCVGDDGGEDVSVRDTGAVGGIGAGRLEGVGDCDGVDAGGTGEGHTAGGGTEWGECLLCLGDNPCVVGSAGGMERSLLTTFPMCFAFGKGGSGVSPGKVGSGALGDLRLLLRYPCRLVSADRVRCRRDAVREVDG
jgi:hypothetical protein